MLQFKNQAQWLALLTAILLLMQSFAIWHDAEHVFHQVDSQCERYEAFSHTPTLDFIPAATTLNVTRFVLTTSSPSIDHLDSKQHGTYAIRAPPSLIS